jgi:hypothetical protein
MPPGIETLHATYPRLSCDLQIISTTGFWCGRCRDVACNVSTIMATYPYPRLSHDAQPKQRQNICAADVDTLHATYLRLWQRTHIGGNVSTIVTTYPYPRLSHDAQPKQWQNICAGDVDTLHATYLRTAFFNN